MLIPSAQLANPLQQPLILQLIQNDPSILDENINEITEDGFSVLFLLCLQQMYPFMEKNKQLAGQIPMSALKEKLTSKAGAFAYCSVETTLQKTAIGKRILDQIAEANNHVILQPTEEDERLSALYKKYQAPTTDIALVKASMKGNKEDVATLLTFDVDLNTKVGTWTAKEWAEKRKRTEIIKLLTIAEEERKKILPEEELVQINIE